MLDLGIFDLVLIYGFKTSWQIGSNSLTPHQKSISLICGHFDLKQGHFDSKNHLPDVEPPDCPW
jgi:hypothetical protein